MSKHKSVIPFIMLSLFLCGCQGNDGKKTASKIPFKTSFILNEKGYENMLGIPAGKFVMGTNPTAEKEYPDSFGFDKKPYMNETPEREVFVETFFIDKYEVTFSEYKAFLDATGRKLPEVWGKIDFKRRGRYPVFGITWEDADAYAKWVNKRLPTETEWEKAARGTDGRKFPWGNTITKEQISDLKWLNKVGTLGFDVSPYGVMDMAGGVSEWTSEWYKPYPGSMYKKDEEYKNKKKVCRGAHYRGEGHYFLDYFCRCAYRGIGDPKENHLKTGFRCVKPLPKGAKLRPYEFKN